MGLLCAYTCKRQQACGKPLLLSKFDKRWRYKQQVEEGEDIDIPYKLIRNLAVILQRKGRGPARQAVSSTTQDLSHFELGRGRAGAGAGAGVEAQAKIEGRQ